MGAKQSSERRAGGGEAPPVGRASTLIGGTPLIDLSRLSRNPNVKILAKAEFLNPSGSIKDRIAQHIIANAEAEGRLKAGDTVRARQSEQEEPCACATQTCARGTWARAAVRECVCECDRAHARTSVHTHTHRHTHV